MIAAASEAEKASKERLQRQKFAICDPTHEHWVPLFTDACRRLADTLVRPEISSFGRLKLDDEILQYTFDEETQRLYTNNVIMNRFLYSNPYTLCDYMAYSFLIDMSKYTPDMYIRNNFVGYAYITQSYSPLRVDRLIIFDNRTFLPVNRYAVLCKAMAEYWGNYHITKEIHKIITAGVPVYDHLTVLPVESVVGYFVTLRTSGTFSNRGALPNILKDDGCTFIDDTTIVNTKVALRELRAEQAATAARVAERAAALKEARAARNREKYQERMTEVYNSFKTTKGRILRLSQSRSSDTIFSDFSYTPLNQVIGLRGFPNTETATYEIPIIQEYAGVIDSAAPKYFENLCRIRTSRETDNLKKFRWYMDIACFSLFDCGFVYYNGNAYRDTPAFLRELVTNTDKYTMTLVDVVRLHKVKPKQYKSLRKKLIANFLYNAVDYDRSFTITDFLIALTTQPFLFRGLIFVVHPKNLVSLFRGALPDIPTINNDEMVAVKYAANVLMRLTRGFPINCAHNGVSLTFSASVPEIKYGIVVNDRPVAIFNNISHVDDYLGTLSTLCISKEFGFNIQIVVNPTFDLKRNYNKKDLYALFEAVIHDYLDNHGTVKKLIFENVVADTWKLSVDSTIMSAVHASNLFISKNKLLPYDIETAPLKADCELANAKIQGYAERCAEQDEHRRTKMQATNRLVTRINQDNSEQLGFVVNGKPVIWSKKVNKNTIGLKNVFDISSLDYEKVKNIPSLIRRHLAEYTAIAEDLNHLVYYNLKNKLTPDADNKHCYQVYSTTLACFMEHIVDCATCVNLIPLTAVTAEYRKAAIRNDYFYKCIVKKAGSDITITFNSYRDLEEACGIRDIGDYIGQRKLPDGSIVDYAPPCIDIKYNNHK